MTKIDADVAIIGGGIVGLATAYALTHKGAEPSFERRLRLTVVEAEDHVAAHQTGHNSGVIHSGIYYRPQSFKAQMCTRGRERLYRFCEDHGLPHERCGKLIVAVAESEARLLDEIAQRGASNGLENLRRLGAEDIREYEPHVRGVAALWVPQTGIVDFRRVAETLARKVEAVGARIERNMRVVGVRRYERELVLETTRGSLAVRSLINCAGLQSDRIARMCGVKPDVRIVPFRGEYYYVRPEMSHLVRHLVYPVPDPRFPFLGVHFTRTVLGELEAGPNAVLAFRREGYRRTSFSLRDTWEMFTWPGALRLFSKHWKTGLAEFQRSFSKRAFLKALQRIVPELKLEDLVPGGTGVRAQAVARDGTLVDDFRIERAERMIHVLNAPSPAATASLEIGETIAAMATKHFARWWS